MNYLVTLSWEDSGQPLRRERVTKIMELEFRDNSGHVMDVYTLRRQIRSIMDWRNFEFDFSIDFMMPITEQM